MYISVTCALVFVHAATLPATAHEGATGVVKERMDMMRSVAQSMKRIHNQLKLGAGLDHAAIAREAASITRHSQDLVKNSPPVPAVASRKQSPISGKIPGISPPNQKRLRQRHADFPMRQEKQILQI